MNLKQLLVLLITVVVTYYPVTANANPFEQDFDATSHQDRLNEAINSGTVDSAGSGAVDAAGSGANRSDPARPERPPEFVEDPETNESYLYSLRQYYEYRATGLQHRTAVFKWQLFSAKVIFSIVLLIVGTGILLAIIQFQAELKRLGQGKTDAMPSTDFEASMNGVKVSSSIVGIIILALSLAFFYLYLIYVYPIEDIF